MAISLSNLATSECQYKNEEYDFTCDEPTSRDTGSKFCIFHDINYLKDDNYGKHKEEVSKRFEKKLSEYFSSHKPLKFIGYCLSYVSFQKKRFTEELYFNDATFYRLADFNNAKFFKGAYFSEATFFEEAIFFYSKFADETYFLDTVFYNYTHFNYTIFEQPNKIIFDIKDLSKVSFHDTDITRIRFSDKVTWGGNDGFTVIEEVLLKNKSEQISLNLVLSVYRNLRENYEYRLRYDEAGKFFTKEMELKRKYEGFSYIYTLENDWFRRNLSLIGLYYHFSNYGESIVKPTMIGAITVTLSTLFWLMQSKPTLEPHFIVSSSSSLYNSTSHFVYLNQAGNFTHWITAFQRSLADFLPLLSLPGEIKVGVIDYIIKIIGGALTFGLIIIALRRKFERKYTR